MNNSRRKLHTLFFRAILPHPQVLINSCGFPVRRTMCVEVFRF
jgi:hypothetical protein